MTNFKPFKADLYEAKNITASFYKHEAKSIMVVKLKEVLPEGSKAREDCDYINQQLAINLIALSPISLLMDFSDFEYSFSNSLIDALSPLYELQIFESKLNIAFLISDLNKHGLASLLSIDLNVPQKNIFFQLDEAIKYVEAEYDSF
jgi:hypothetical protein